jgi:hypothetical protein
MELERWHDFYVLVGTAGATLVALLFVAISLGAGFLTDKRANATRAFFSPVVVHFTAVFFYFSRWAFPRAQTDHVRDAGRRLRSRWRDDLALHHGAASP